MIIITIGDGNASLVVATSDASEMMKAHADFVCDGIDDQHEINEAMDIVTAQGGGEVKLVGGESGAFNMTGVHLPSYSHMQGVY